MVVVSLLVVANYLIQDHRFLDSFLILLGAALASADRFEALPCRRSELMNFPVFSQLAGKRC